MQNSKYKDTKNYKVSMAKYKALQKYDISSLVFYRHVQNGCEECGFNEYVLDFTYLGKEKKKENLKYLCPNCHKRYTRAWKD